MTTKICETCGESFNPNSPEKRKAGGLIVHCPNCSFEREFKTFAVVEGDIVDKETQIKIVRVRRPKKKSEEIAIVVGDNPREFEEPANDFHYIDLTLDDEAKK